MKTINKIIMAILLMASFASCSNEREQKVIATEEIIREDSSLAILAKTNDGVELGFFVQQDAPNQVILVHCEKDKIPASGHVTIPNQFKSKGVTYTVTGIKSYVFSNCESLTSVTIPNSVTDIGESAFEDCTSLTSITIPKSVTNIGDHAFEGCTSLMEIDVSEGNRKFDDRENCNAIIETASNTMVKACRNTTIPNSVTTIGRGAFASCEGLTSITIPANVTNIEEFAFSACPNLTKIVVADGNRVFDSRNNCNAIIETASNTLVVACRNTTIPNSVTNIGRGAFASCSSLTSITIPNSVTSIGDNAFDGCSSLTSITIPNSVVFIGESAFGDCSGLTSVSIPNGVKSLGRHAFSGCESLTSITIPQGVNCIEEWTFATCWELTSVSIPNSVTSIGDFAFYGCKGIESLTIPYGVTSIGDYAFQDCSGLTSVTFPYGVTNIGYDAFRGCTSLTSVTIPSSVTNIGMGAFCGCTGLTSATILNPDLQSQYDYVFIGCDNLPSGEYVWIVGTWACDMGPYGTVVVKFDGDGSSGTCTEAQYGSYKTGTYNVSGNTLRYKLYGESGTTTIEIEPGHKLSAGGGYYYHKRDNGDEQRNEANNNGKPHVPNDATKGIFSVGYNIQSTPIEVSQEATFKDLFNKDAGTCYFSENDLMSLSAKELTYLRNSIYARHGYVFKSQELNNYFKQFEWYHPDSNVTEAALNGVEKINAEFIRNYQKQNGKTYIPNNATKGIFSVGYSQ